MAGDTWGDPIVFGDADLPFTITTETDYQYKILKYVSTSHIRHTRYNVTQTPEPGSFSNLAYTGLPAAGAGAAASVSGTNQVGSWGPYAYIGYIDDPGTDFYIQMYCDQPAGNFTIDWTVTPAPPPRPYDWDEAEDITSLIVAGTTASVEYDAVGTSLSLWERHYKFVIPDGVAVEFLPDTAGEYAELYVHTEEPWAGDYLGYCYTDADSSANEPFFLTGDGTTMYHMVIYPNIPDDGVTTANMLMTASSPEPPPAYTVDNDLVTGAVLIDINSNGSIDYDNTGATTTDTLLPGMSSSTRDIWFKSPAISATRYIQFTATASDADLARQAEVSVYTYNTSTSTWQNPQRGYSGSYWNPITYVIPPGSEIYVQLWFEHGNLARWETAGVLTWLDRTPELPADADPANPTTQTIGSTLTFPDFGNMYVNRYTTFTANGQPFNLYKDGTLSGSSGAVYVNGVYRGGVATRTASAPTAYSQFNADVGDTVLIKWNSRNGESFSYALGSSGPEDVTWLDWLDSANNAQYVPGDGGDPGAFHDYVGPAYLYDIKRKRWTGSSTVDSIIYGTAGIDTSGHESEQIQAIDEAVHNAGYSMVDEAYWTAELSWSMGGRLWNDPANNNDVRESTAGVQFCALNFDGYFDGLGNLRDYASTDTKYKTQVYQPLYRHWNLIYPQLPAGRFAQYPSRAQIRDYAKNGNIFIEWSDDVEDNGNPYKPVIATTFGGSWSNNIGYLWVGSHTWPLYEATAFLNPAKIRHRRFDFEGAVESWAMAPDFVNNDLLLHDEPVAVTFGNDFDGATDGWQSILVDEGLRVHPNSWYAFWVTGDNMTYRQPIDPDEAVAFANANGFFLGPSWSLSAGATLIPGVRIKFADQFRVGWTAPRFDGIAPMDTTTDPGYGTPDYAPYDPDYGNNWWPDYADSGVDPIVDPGNMYVEVPTPPELSYLPFDLSTNSQLGEVPFEDVSYTHKLSAAGSASFSLPVTPDMLKQQIKDSTTPGRTGIYIIRDQEIVWGGIIWKRGYDSSSRRVRFEAGTFESYFNHRFQSSVLGFEDVDQLTIARTLALQAADEIHVDVDEAFSGVNRYYNAFYYDFKTLGSEIDSLASLWDGFDWNIRVYLDDQGIIRRRLVWGYPYLGVSAEDTQMIFEYPGNIRSYSVTEDADKAGNRIWAVGGGQGLDQIQFEQLSQVQLDNGWPLLETTTQYKDVFDPIALEARSKVDLQRLMPPVTIINATVDPFAEPNVHSYYPGDWARFIIQDNWNNPGIDMKRRIIGYTVSVDAASPLDRVVLEIDGEGAA